MIVRALLGLALAGAIALGARAARSLTSSGAIAATIVGTAAVAAGWSWGILVILYFISSTLLSRSGRTIKERRTASIVAKGGERDAAQVFANGAVFTCGAIATLIYPDPRWLALGAGSLAAAAADTWATEIGIRYGGEPRSILSGRRVPAGTSGGVTMIGSMAAIAGAAFVAILAWLMGWTPAVAGYVAIGGVVGAAIDSVVGATVQARRWCDRCGRETERTTHDCGTPTRRLRGLSWLDNDLVNLLSNAVGGVLAMLLLR